MVSMPCTTSRQGGCSAPWRLAGSFRGAIMNAKDAIKTSLTSTKEIVSWYLSDLSDADLLVRPVPAANHIAWQLGHLIDSESHLLGQLPGAAYPKLPAGWSDQHGKNTAAVEPPKGFATKAEY